MKDRSSNAVRAVPWLIVILVASVLLRAAAAFYLGNTVEILPGTYDQVSYHTLAQRLLAGHGFTFGEMWWPITPAGDPTAHWSYLYTLFLAGVYALFGPNPLVARLIQVTTVGILQPLLAYLIGKWCVDHKTGLIAALLTAAYAYFIYYSAALMTESFYITGILGVLYLTFRLAAAEKGREMRWAIALGISLGLVVLLRQLFLLVVPFLLLWLFWIRFRAQRPWPLKPALVVVMLFVALILPFTAYNYLRFDRFVLLNTNAGYAFFWANHPIHGTQFQPILPPEMGPYEALIPAELRHLDEAALDQALLGRGLQFVADEPGRYLLLSLSRVPAYFMFWPSADSGLVSNIARLASFGLLWPWMILGIALAFIQRRVAGKAEAALMLLFALVYTGIHLLSWALVRYRLPVDAVLVVFAALALVPLVERITARRAQTWRVPVSDQ